MAKPPRKKPKPRVPKTLPWMQGFLSVLSECGSIKRACDASGIYQNSAYHAKKRNPEFSQKWDEAIVKASDDIEQEIRRRGLKGVKEDVYYQGQVVGQRIAYSDNLLMFYAKGLMPEKYRDRISADINSKVSVDLDSVILQARKRANPEIHEKIEHKDLEEADSE